MKTKIQFEHIIDLKKTDTKIFIEIERRRRWKKNKNNDDIIFKSYKQTMKINIS